MRKTEELLYELVQTAREHCCGDAPQVKQQLLLEIEKAIDFARWADASMSIRNKLIEARRIISVSKEYAERLPADELLCNILNNELKESG